ncbi:hypothetical protein B7463_g6107, partial [Scytalidium lignicola]
MSSTWLLLLVLLHLASCATATLTENPAYQSQRPCARNCFYIGFSLNGGPDRLAQGIGCDVDPISNDCFCRPDLQQKADSYILSCVRSGCGNTLDINSAVTIYDNYCTSAGFYRVTDAPATTTAGTQDSPTTVTVTVVHTVSVSSAERRLKPPLAELIAQTTSLISSSPTSTSTDTNSRVSSDGAGMVTAPKPSSSGNNSSAGGNNSSGNNLGTGEIIGIVVGILGFLVTAVGSWIAYKTYKNQRNSAN